MTGPRALLARGKVRDIYDAGDASLLLVASDRISAFDVVLPNPIPNKGRVLTGLSLFWFERMSDLVGNHVVTASQRQFPRPFDRERELAGRSMVVRRAEVVRVECVARGYLSGSGWTQYQRSGSVCGVGLPPGIVEAERLGEPIFTPTTKAPEGHDEPLEPDELAGLIGRGLSERLKELTLAIYERAAAVSLERGIILADTKFEFGFSDGELILVDEVCTPDSSRFWPLTGYHPGRPQPSFDKQPVRDWLDATGWDREPPPPELPDEIIRRTSATYVEAYERITEERFVDYVSRMGGGEQEPGGA